MAQSDLANSVRGTKWINDGVSDRRIPLGHIVPTGWKYGRHRGNFRNIVPRRGDDNPYRVQREKEQGFQFLPVDHPWVSIAYAINQRCRDRKIPFGFASAQALAIYLNEIMPSHCPVFGVPLTFVHRKVGTQRGFRGSLPSVDRIKPEVGYVRGNLQIISFRANAMKSDASDDELRMFAEWILRRPH